MGKEKLLVQVTEQVSGQTGRRIQVAGLLGYTLANGLHCFLYWISLCNVDLKEGGMRLYWSVLITILGSQREFLCLERVSNFKTFQKRAGGSLPELDAGQGVKGGEEGAWLKKNKSQSGNSFVLNCIFQYKQWLECGNRHSSLLT